MTSTTAQPTTELLTTDMIDNLRAEAVGAGDRDQVRVCDLAWSGDREARVECAEAITSARAMDDVGWGLAPITVVAEEPTDT